MKKNNQPILKEGNINYVFPFILITTCFALWGFANDITNPMVKAFSKIFRMSVTEGSLVQVAFYGAILPWPSLLPCSSANIPIKPGLCSDWAYMPSEPFFSFRP